MAVVTQPQPQPEDGDGDGDETSASNTMPMAQFLRASGKPSPLGQHLAPQHSEETFALTPSDGADSIASINSPASALGSTFRGAATDTAGQTNGSKRRQAWNSLSQQQHNNLSLSPSASSQASVPQMQFEQ
jgi:hypothetical protein